MARAATAVVIVADPIAVDSVAAAPTGAAEVTASVAATADVVAMGDAINLARRPISASRLLSR